MKKIIFIITLPSLRDAGRLLHYADQSPKVLAASEKYNEPPGSLIDPGGSIYKAIPQQ